MRDFDNLIEAAERFAGPGVGTGSLPSDRPAYRAKRLLRATLPDGKIADRRTHHDYKLVVAVRSPNGSYWANRGVPWGVFRWTTTVKLADKAVREAQRTGAYDEIRIVPVVDQQDPK